MGSFKFSAPILAIGSTLGSDLPLLSLVPFFTMYLDDPWTLPSPSTSDDISITTKMDMPLYATQVAYQTILDSIFDHSPSSSRKKEEDLFSLPSWEVVSSRSHDFLDDVFPLDEETLKAMNGPEQPWEKSHHRSYFLLELEQLEHDDFRMTLGDNVGYPMVPLGAHGVYAEGNMANLSPTIPINIFRIPSKIKNVYISVYCSPD